MPKDYQLCSQCIHNTEYTGSLHLDTEPCNSCFHIQGATLTKKHFSPAINEPEKPEYYSCDTCIHDAEIYSNPNCKMCCNFEIDNEAEYNKLRLGWESETDRLHPAIKEPYKRKPHKPLPRRRIIL